ncbi:MAG: tetratricopeptide repeat protein [Betaproteobacteria bacterium]|nr:MAG: tetratricopeptide repeat protein [Betaproteobacteria bacterium]
MSTILSGTAPSRTRTVTNMIPSATAMCTFRTFITGTVTDCSRALAIASLAAAAYAAPYVPKDDTAVLERLPVRPGDPVARELRQLRAELTANPRKRETAVRLAERYFALASSEGDPRYVGYAQAALKPWWDLPAPPLDVLVMRAILKQYSHDFSGAMRDLETATREDPMNARAWSWRAAIHMVQADYERAREDCLALQKLESELYAVGCIAYLDGTTGKAAAAHRALSAALAKTADVQPEVKVWVLTRLAEMALRQGDVKQAEEHFRAAYFEPINDQFLLAAYADFLLDQGRPEEVVPLLVDWVKSDILLLRLALAEQALKAPKAREHIEALRSRFDAAALRGDKLHQQEEARFNLYLLGNKEKALALARENWKLQREPRDARILLEAALAMKDPGAAQEALDWLERSGQEDPGLRRTAEKLKALKR